MEILRNIQSEYYENQYVFGDFAIDPIVFLESIYFDKFAIAEYNTSKGIVSKSITGFIIAVNLARRICMEHKEALANAILSKSVDDKLIIELMTESLSLKNRTEGNNINTNGRRRASFTLPSDDNDYILFEQINNTKGIQIFSNKDLPLHKAFKELAEGTLESPLIVSRNKNRAAGFFLALMAEKGLLPDNYLELIKNGSLLVTFDEKNDVPIQSLKNGKSENWYYLTEYELDMDDSNIYSRLVKLLKTLDMEGKFQSHPLPYSIPVCRSSFRN